MVMGGPEVSDPLVATADRPTPQPPSEGNPMSDGPSAEETAQHLRSHLDNAELAMRRLVEADGAIMRAHLAVMDIGRDDWGGDGEIRASDHNEATDILAEMGPKIRRVRQILALYRSETEDVLKSS